MPPDLALLLTLIGSNYPCLELLFMVPKVFEPLKFDCTCKCHTVKPTRSINYLFYQHKLRYDRACAWEISIFLSSNFSHPFVKMEQTFVYKVHHCHVFNFCKNKEPR